MNKCILFLVSFFIFSSSQAQCDETEEVKVLLIGDSWAFFMGVDGTFDNVMEKWGHTNYRYFTNFVVAENGAQTDDFLKADKQEEITSLMQQYPEIEVIHLSIAGNDVLGDWNVNYTQQELDDLIDEVYGRTLEIVDFLKSTKPGIKIVFSGYVYPNFEEVIETENPLGNSHPFYGTWEDMDFPSFIEINTILNDFSEIMETYAAADEQVEFFKATGLLQQTFGQNDSLGVAPWGAYPPYTQPMPFGDPNYPSPKNSMRDYFGITKDCFHLSPKGYRDLIGYHFQKFYHHYLMEDQYLLSNLGEDGYVSSLANTGAGLKMGVDNGEEFATIVSFSTENMNEDFVEKGEIFLQVNAVSGSNPLDAALEISVKKGNFGNNASPDAGDWSSAVDATGIPCLYGLKSEGNWIRIKLPSEVLQQIDPNGKTQFRIQSSASSVGYVEFTDASDDEFAPVLNIKFGEPTGWIENEEQSALFLFPNPSKNEIRIAKQEQEITEYQIIDVLGKVCLKVSGSNLEKIDLTDLNAGYYQVSLKMGDLWLSRSVVKE